MGTVIKMERNFTYLTLNTQFVLMTNGIKNVIFDLGGVIINLSVEKTHQAFASLGKASLDEIKQKVQQGDFFRQYEMGLVSDHDFRHYLRMNLNINARDEEIDKAWNAMLLDIPPERIRLLEQLRGKYRLFLLSNTNNIHLQCFNEKVYRITGHKALDVYFERAFYSHQVKLAKPDVAIYQYVLSTGSLHPAETLFLDDNPDNILGANQAGIHTFHVQNPDQLFTLFS
jgi:epoxide hydrolase-like predicted phosphatase